MYFWRYTRVFLGVSYMDSLPNERGWAFTYPILKFMESVTSQRSGTGEDDML